MLLDPEEGNNVNGRLNASLAAFRTRKDNLAVKDGNNTTPDGEQAYVAVDGTKGTGWELEVAGELARGLQLQGGYTHFRNKDSAGLPLDTEQPVRLFKFFASYRLPAMPRLTLTAGMRWQSRTFESRRGAPTSARHIIDSYGIWNAGLRYDFSDRVNLSLLVSKLTDKTYRVSTSTHTYGPPRNVAATLRYRFD